MNNKNTNTQTNSSEQSKPAFTPGPWAKLKARGVYTCVLTYDQKNATGKNNTYNDGCAICDTYGSDSDANASLIAAAPEMLEMLEKISTLLPYLSQDSTATPGSAEYDAYEVACELPALISKAKGLTNA